MTDLSISMAMGTGFGPGAFLTSAAPTPGTQFALVDVDLLLCPESGFLEIQGHVVTKIGPALDPAPGPSPMAETKKILKNVPETGKDIVEPTEPGKARTLKPGVAELIVYSSFLRISQDFIGFRSFLEIVFGVLVVGISVRMIF
jgi:hypothetical protein